MYALVKTGGKQYKVAVGERLNVERLDGEIGGEIILDQVLMVSDGEDVKVGAPTVGGAQVVTKIVDQTKGEKIIIFKHKRRKGYRKTNGHRQQLTTLQILDIKS